MVDVNKREVFVKIKKYFLFFFFFFGGGGGSGWWWWWGGQDGCERRIEVFVKIQKKKWGGSGRGSGLGGQGRCEFL